MKPYLLPHPAAPRLASTLTLLALAFGSLSACTSIGRERVEGWPELTVVEHRVPHHVMRDRCGPYTPAFMSPEACAEFFFVQGECHIWFSADFPPPPYLVRHEHDHCRGFEHAGETTLRDILARYAAAQEAPASAGPGGPAAPDSGGAGSSAGF